ncbi:MAG: hypothetical protein M0D53_12830 [Flavobacterium sp. JAD_PAG50586_2]|nr:MAG: hypothetical protein M0D53_12830 [Flavobacterium sp. JAD_PAG50586_2]
MARQNGIVVLNGTIAGLNFYIRKGEAFVRKAGGGFEGEAIKKKASMVRVRENSSEFGGCAKAVKQFKIALHPLLAMVKDGGGHNRLVQLFSQIKNLDEVSVRGERNVYQGLLSVSGREKLLGYVITPGPSLEPLLLHAFGFGWGAEGFTILNFLPSKLAFPKGATHLELQSGYLVIDFEQRKHSFASSAPFIIEKMAEVTSIQVAPDSVPVGNGFRIGVVLLRFMQEINGVLYPLKEAPYTVMEVVSVEAPFAPV